MELNSLQTYCIARNLSNTVWDLVIRWDNFGKDTVGKQLVRAVDSISANIAEGYGRYTKKDKIHFYRYAYGSVLESTDWVSKTHSRQLINTTNYQEIDSILNNLPKEINGLIKFTREKLSI
jgi:four helix bundle protein